MTAVPAPENIKPHRWGWVLLFTSTTTLLCCALPIALVALGFGAVSAALFSNFPFLAVLAHHKVWLFSGSAVLLLLAAWALYRPGRACPVDPVLAVQCEKADRWNRRFLIIAASLWGLGFTAAYLSLPLLELYDKIFRP
jgi:mercuric ion transport protein